MLDNFTPIQQDSLSDKIIKQIRSLIVSGELKAGHRLPSERKLAEKLGVSRTQVRDAIRKLEFYGILKTLPQSGTIVAGIGIPALKGLISDVLNLEESDFISLVETRVILEVNAAKLAAIRRTDSDIKAIKQAIQDYENKLNENGSAVEEDFIFHLKIAEASKNDVLKSLMLIITPDIIQNYNAYNVCDLESELKAIQEHKQILAQIIDKDSEAAGKIMKAHLQDVMEFSRITKFV